jgi:hypothetical protein
VKQDSILRYFQLIPNLLSQPTGNAALERVIDPELAGITVTLYYNCAYMNNICDNADSFAGTTRGVTTHPISRLGNNIYGYDFNTGRKENRRDTVCPDGTWKRNHPCPDPLSSSPFRSDKVWWTASLEPGTTVNQIANKRSLATNQVTINSGIRYTCDEFPPASWVEGGSGAYYSSAGTTRCAAARCAPNINAEQDCTQSQVFLNSNDCC